MTALEQLGPGGKKERAQRPTVGVLLWRVRLDWETSGGRLFEGVFECTLHLKWKLAYFLILSNCAVGWKVSQFYLWALHVILRQRDYWHSGFPSPCQISFVVVLFNHHSPNAYPRVLFLVPMWPQVATPSGPMLFSLLAVIVAILKAQIVRLIQHMWVQGESSNCPSVIFLLLKKFLMLPLKLLLRWERPTFALLRTATAATLCLYYINLSRYIKQHLAPKL